MEKLLWQHILAVRQYSPLVHSITNYVVMNNTANAVLAIGASPIMAHAHLEVQDVVTIANSLVINMGTLDENWVNSMILAVEKAEELKKPWVLDPVGVGATKYRNQVVERLIQYKPTVIRANASEVMAIANYTKDITKGVDSSINSDKALDAARFLVDKLDCIVSISGKTDFLVTKNQVISIDNGDDLMTKVTGLGCSTTAVIGAFVGAIENKVEATIAAMALMSIAGELAASKSKGPGSLQVNILDQLFTMTEEVFLERIKIDITYVNK